ncbi:unnamed protein product [Peronospora farinosa]|uniref:Uncharacterized protein n=1 Tax=Peronospora farinosa TaxID=134698 RepID=A0ABN8CFM4_9STRA|nr:unnamed protein product [Peronospora farinosa]
MRIVFVSTASTTEKVSDLKSLDASGSKAGTKSREQRKTTKGSANVHWQADVNSYYQQHVSAHVSKNDELRQRWPPQIGLVVVMKKSIVVVRLFPSVAEDEGDDANEKNKKTINVEQE